MPIVCAVSILLAALLLFAVQPMVGRLVLPSLGGSPAVWNTVMVFFQASLLIGYALAHAVGRMPRGWQQAAAQAALLAGALVLMPIGVDAASAAERPIAALLLALGAGVGLPAVALATMSPLIQLWYARTLTTRTGRAHSRDPYVLYAASNAGSLLGLLGYPLLAEPLLGVDQQRLAWSIGLGLLAAVLLPVWIGAARSGPPAAAGETDARDASDRGAWLWWVVLALVPSSLLLGVTQHLTTDIAAVPLLWAVPLALYLVTFIVAFGGRAEAVLANGQRAVPLAAIALVVAMLVEAKHPLIVVMLLHLAAFFVIAQACHARLATLRPPADRLTRFYLCVSLGGVLGGAINALAAPLLLNWIAEYPIMLAMGAMLAVGRPVLRWRSLLPGLGFAALVGALLLTPLTAAPMFGLVFTAGGALGCYLLSKHALPFGLALLAVLVLPEVLDPDDSIVRRERTFFGVHTVMRDTVRPTIDETVTRHTLKHGGTIHGLQNLGDNTPWTYYHPFGPLGEIIDHARRASGPQRIGAIGLGVGSLAAYANPGDTVTFFEIDPAVIAIAQDPALFTFLDESLGGVEHIVGDGRLTIAGTGPFDLIVLDAFTSDAIPVHLLTAEAFALYADELAPGGLIAVHLSNRHLELGRVVAGGAAAAGLNGLIVTDDPTPELLRLGQEPSTWAVLAADPAALDDALNGWTPLTDLADPVIWTDDRSSILGVLRLD
ncbi:MAG: fused MFS/spermidine synthase [Planctomycetota bacterium]